VTSIAEENGAADADDDFVMVDTADGTPTAGKRDHMEISEVPADSPPPKKKKKSTCSGGGEVACRNDLQTLNELVPGLQYNCVSQTGPVHEPTFTIQVEVNGQVCTVVLCTFYFE